MKKGILTIVLTALLVLNHTALAEPTTFLSQEEFTAKLINLPKEVQPEFLKWGRAKFPSFDPNHAPPAGTKTFELSQQYPADYKVGEKFPWEKIDFKSHPNEYLFAVLDYCLEGNRTVDFKVQNNTVRKWYHAPWLHDDFRQDSNGDPNGAGREYHRGMTRERRSREFELHTLQDVRAQNWAVGFYNDRGGYTLGKVWKTASGFPDPTKANFPDNTVTFKLLFTDAPVAKVPYLKGSLEWTANIYSDTSYKPPRLDRTVRLLQIDVAVKDPRVSAGTGWIFGTLIYDGDSVGKNPWNRMVPVGISWGDDGSEDSRINEEGAFVNTSLQESRLNSFLIEVPDADYGHKAYMRHFGLGGRLNGPVDNPISSCISCHGRAGTYADALPVNSNSGKPLPFANFSIRRPRDFPSTEFPIWFSQVRGGSHVVEFELEKYQTTDYSLQVSAGIRNFYEGLKRRQVDRQELLFAHRLMVEAPAAFQVHKPLPIVTREIDED